MSRVILISLIFLSAIFTTPWLTLPFAAMYSLRWYAPELLMIGCVIDIYFGVSGTWPIYTVTAFVLVMAAELGKKHVMLK